MCLDRGWKEVTPTGLISSGWKSFSGSFASPRFQNFALGNTSVVPLDRWITAEGTKRSTGLDYEPGFHIYSDERDNGYDPRHVYFRNVHVVGKQSGKPVVIAREMYVPSDPNAWPK